MFYCLYLEFNSRIVLINELFCNYLDTVIVVIDCLGMLQAVKYDFETVIQVASL